ncbi:MAG: glycosyltransferase family 4 protein [bacterium]
MKVLHVVHGYPPSTGGSQILMQELSERLVADYGDEVTVFTTNAYHMESFWTPGLAMMPPGIEAINGVQVRRFPVFNRFSPFRKLLAAFAYRLHLPYSDWLRTLQNGPLIRDMTDAVARSGADVALAAAFPLMHMYYALKGTHRAGIPLVLLGAIHASDSWGYDRNMIYQAIQRADAYIALTPFERDFLVERRIEENKIEVIGPGVDPDAFAGGDGATARERYGWGAAPVVAMMGKQTRRKGFDVLLAAMQHVWATHPDTHLLLAGARTPYSRQIIAMVQGLPSAQRERVTIVGDFAEDEKPDLLSACDIFVLPSGQEAFGIAFIEAWACSRPVIGVRAGPIPSVIDEGKDGILVNYQDADDLAHAILELLAEPERRAQMGKAGQEKVLRQYTWDNMTRRVREVYRKVLSVNPGWPKKRQAP